jgi:ketohexokinase
VGINYHPFIDFRLKSPHSVPHFPEEDSKLRATTLTKRRGGNCPNTLEVLQQLLSIDPHFNDCLLFLGTLPARDSQATKTITDSLKGIDFSHCIYREECQEAASSYIIKSEAEDSRTIVNYNELPEMTVSEFIGAANAVGRGEGGGTGVWWHFEVYIYRCLHMLRMIWTV